MTIVDVTLVSEDVSSVIEVRAVWVSLVVLLNTDAEVPKVLLMTSLEVGGT